jgi:4-coumarate--CoA ligase
LGSGGQLIPGTTAKVVKADGSLAKIGELGELLVQGGQITLGYYKNDEALVYLSLVGENILSDAKLNRTKDTYVDGYVCSTMLTPLTQRHSWLRTGDEVLFRENGDLFIVDRIKVKINSMCLVIWYSDNHAGAAQS